MTTSQTTGQNPLSEASREDVLTALFLDLVMRQTSMALLFLGQSPNPQTGERTVDLEAAQLFIDQLEMIEAKTRGNLSEPEARLLRQHLANLRMLFVQVSERPPAPNSPAGPAPDPTPPAQPVPPDPKAAAPEPPAQPEDATKVKYSKKY
jgi:hypothetical protein